MEQRLGSSPDSKAVFVGNPISIPPKPLQRPEIPGQDVRISQLSTDRVFSDVVLQWWDVHAGYFGCRPAQDA